MDQDLLLRPTFASNESLMSFSARAADGPAADVHARMPLILPRNAEYAWLNRAQEDGERVLEMAQSVAETAVEFHAVSTRVNNARNAGADLIEPFPNPL